MEKKKKMFPSSSCNFFSLKNEKKYAKRYLRIMNRLQKNECRAEDMDLIESKLRHCVPKLLNVPIYF